MFLAIEKSRLVPTGICGDCSAAPSPRLVANRGKLREPLRDPISSDEVLRDPVSSDEFDCDLLRVRSECELLDTQVSSNDLDRVLIWRGLGSGVLSVSSEDMDRV